MKLVIDIGNTRIKIGLFEAEAMLDIRISDDVTPDQLEFIIKTFNDSRPEYSPIKHTIISAVRNYPDEIKNLLCSKYHFIELGHELPLPIKLKYKTPATLGNDRIALAVAATGLFPAQNVLIIDAGTCITYDFVNGNKEYYGGGISPGIVMRFKALNTFTDKLPLVSRRDKIDLIGDSTENSIQSGVMNGVIAEVNGIIEKYESKFSDLKIILTGGDANYFDKYLKNNIFANSNIVLAGLNMILDYNVEA
jgi:type III pantothenate kinase